MLESRRLNHQGRAVLGRGGRTNIAYNCLDRHVATGLGDKPCLLWEGNEPGRDRVLTYSQVLQEVCRLVRYPPPGNQSFMVPRVDVPALNEVSDPKAWSLLSCSNLMQACRPTSIALIACA